MCAFISSGSSVVCPCVAPESRALWPSFAGVVLGLHPSAESARAALPMLRALVALAHFVRAVFAVVEYERGASGIARGPDAMHAAARDALVELESEWEENEDIDANVIRAACVRVFGTDDVCALVAEPWRFGVDEAQARCFVTLVECALGLARSLDAPARETAAQG